MKELELKRFEQNLREEERSANTISKYVRDVSRFLDFAGDSELSSNNYSHFSQLIRRPETGLIQSEQDTE